MWTDTGASEYDDIKEHLDKIDPEKNFLHTLYKESNYYNDNVLSKTLKGRKALSIIHFNAISD